LVAVHTPAPASVDEDNLRRTLSQGWGLAMGEIRYVPKGAGSYHWTIATDGGRTQFVTVDDLDAKPWIADTGDRAFEGLAAV
jgi:hypothetical protein